MNDRIRIDTGTNQSVNFLKNGVKMIVVEKPNAPVHLRLITLGGDALNPGQTRGSAHFAEHMILAGTERYPSKDRIALHMDQYGGSAGGATSAEVMYMNIRVAAGEYIENVFSILRELLEKSTLSPKVMETERGAILSEYKGAYAKSESKTARAFMEAILKGTAYEFPVLGSLDTISGISVTDIQDFLRRQLKGGKIGVVLSGDISRKEAVRLCEEALSFIQDSPVERLDPKQKILVPENFDPSLQVQHIEANEDVSNVRIGFRMPNLSNSEYRKEYGLIAGIVGGGRSSLLNTLFRYETGLVYSISAGVSSYMAGPGMFQIGTNCRSEHLVGVVAKLLDFMKKDALNLLTEERFLLAKKKQIALMKTSFETAEQWISFHHSGSIRTEDTTIDDEVNMWQDMTYERFCLAAAHMFSPKNIYLSYSSKENKDEEIKALFSKD